ncbi:MAG: GntR family transcriptional regulator, partial [Deltaproteobacteria bacterium]|nr:GntR family transcriptional regulator [Deltaproteobacteria bacterium]
MNGRLSTTQQVVDTVVSGIHKGTFKPGQRLPSQREMARLFGVSRTAVREAIKVLEGREIVASRRGSGIFICRGSEAICDGEDPRSGQALVMSTEEVMSFARQIWYASLEQAVQHATDDEIAQLNALSCEFHGGYRNTTPLQEAYIYETSFGMRICKASRNPLNYAIMLQLLKITTDIDYNVVSDRALYKEVIAIDLRITEAMKERDTGRALFWAKERDR